LNAHEENPGTEFDISVDVLVVGSGAGGMAAAMVAQDAGLNTLMVEKAPLFGGSTALSGGSMWVPGAPPQIRVGHRPDPDGVLGYLRQITAGKVSDARLKAYVEVAPRMVQFIEDHTDAELRWKPGYSDYFPELPGGSPEGSVINLEPIDLRRLGADETKLLPRRAIAPRGMWMRPHEVRDFLAFRQSWRGKLVLLRFLWRALRARVTGERVATLGQALVAHLWLGMRRLGVSVWLDSPLRSLIESGEGEVIGAIVGHEGRDVRVRADAGVIIASGGFEHNPEMRHRFQPFVTEDLSLGADSNTGDGIRAGQVAGGALAQMDVAWWFPTLVMPGGALHLMLSERMMPAQFIVNAHGERFIKESTPYSEFGHAIIAAEASDPGSMPCWYVTDSRAWRRYVIAGHLPLPRIPAVPVTTGREMPAAWLRSGMVKQANSWRGLAEAIGVPADALEKTARRYNELAASGHDDDFGRGDSAYDRFYGDPTLANPSLASVETSPFYAFKIVLGDLGTNGGLVTDEDARVLHDGTPIRGLYATGNAAASVMGRSYAGAGATIGAAMTFGFLAAKDIAARATKTATDLT
jgi:3-oxosteroid 1-dehydrogenase